MAYVRKNKVGGREYYQLVEPRMVDGKRRQKMLAHLGVCRSVDAALDSLPRRIDLQRRKMSKCPARLRPGRERRLAALEDTLATLRQLREQGMA